MTHQYNEIILYARYSSDAQSDGTSLERQSKTLRAWIEKEGLASVPQTIVTDEGASGFHGHHRTVGNFGKMEAEIRDGLHRGALFICENLDRFTRQGPAVGLKILNSYTEKGVTVATLAGDFFTADKELGLVEILTAAVKLDQAKDESQKKSVRASANWTIVRDRCLENGTMPRTNIAPWLRVDKSKKAHVIEDRAALVRRMFRLSDEGKGEGKIAAIFEEEGIPVWNQRKTRNAKVWQRTQIRKILSSRKVVGEWQPMSKESGKLLPAGEPWVSHLPQIVPHELFDRVQANREARENVGGGRRSKRLANLFSTLLVCADCGGNYHYSNGRREGSNWTDPRTRKRYSYKRDCGSLVCRTAVVSRGVKCGNRGHWAYLTFEDAVTKALLHLSMDDMSFSNRGELSRVSEIIANLSREAEVYREKSKRLWGVFAENGSDGARMLAEEQDKEVTAISDRLDGLRQQHRDASGRVSNAKHLARIEDIRRDLYCDDMAKRVALRTKVAVSLRSLIESVTMTDHKAFIRLKDGVGSLIVDRKGEIGGLDTFKDYRENRSELDDYKRRRKAAIEAGTSPFSKQENVRQRK